MTPLLERAFAEASKLPVAEQELLASRLLAELVAEDAFDRAVADLTHDHVPVRAFILVRPPFMTEAEGLEWAKRSIDFAFDAGVECCALIPTRGGNGALEDLAKHGHFVPPSLETLEAALDYGVRAARGRVFADVWDIEKLVACGHCAGARIDRLRHINLTQCVQPPVVCDRCGSRRSIEPH